MRLTISGKNFTLTEGIKDAAEEKIKKIERLVGDDASVAVLVSAKKGKINAKRAWKTNHLHALSCTFFNFYLLYNNFFCYARDIFHNFRKKMMDYPL